MAKKHDHGFEMMAIVAIVAVVGLIIMFMNSSGSSTSENLVGEAFNKKDLKQEKEEWMCVTKNTFSGLGPQINEVVCITIEGEGKTLFCGSSEEEIIENYLSDRDINCGMCTSNIPCQGADAASCSCSAKKSNHAEYCAPKTNPNKPE